MTAGTVLPWIPVHALRKRSRSPLACLVVHALGCGEPTATSTADAGADTSSTAAASTGATTEPSGDTTAAATTGTTTGAPDDCGPCLAWESCVGASCEPAPGRCGGDEDCGRGQHCDADHACTCDEGLFANAGKCVDRILFALPMDNADGAHIGNVIGVDNDPAVGESDLDCVSYDGEPFPRCYDDHTGTDFLLKGGFAAMDAGSAAVFAAADGEVVLAHDGEYDRCALDLQVQAVRCEDGGPITPPNEITVLHADGVATRYLHLKKNSLLVAEGDAVTCGQPIALVGSSGNSSAPHLHFEVVGVDGEPVDPFAGTYSQPETYWVEQDGADGLPGAACQ